MTPWFGAGLRGGAEQQSYELARHLAAAGHAVEVLTTCCASFADDWGRNALRAGIERHGDITIRRFRTDRRDRRAFERVNAILLSLDAAKLRRSVSPVGDEDAETFCKNSINSSALYAYLANDGHRYDRIVFVPYMFGTTLYGLPIVAERAYLQPCLHLEPYAYLARVSATVHAARGLLFNSDGEFAVAVSLYGPGIIEKSFVVGEGIDPLVSAAPDTAKTGDFIPAQERYVLYLGRQDPAKNVATLVAAFKDFRRASPAAQLKLVFAGHRQATYADSTLGIVDLGSVTDAVKAALLQHCRALVQPSTKESFSRVIYEAWLYGRPVVVHADCPPTVDAVDRSGGGYVARSTSDWQAALQRIAGDTDATLSAIGRRGRAYAETATRWDAVIARYERAFEVAGEHATIAKTRQWDGIPDAPLASALSDGKTNLLYTGRVQELGSLEALLVVFLHYLTMNREARLTIAAIGPVDEEVYEALQSEVRRLDLVDRLLVARDLGTPQLQALYLTADVFITLDPSAADTRGLRDAMWFDIPVLALDTPANRTAAGNAAILIEDTSDLLAVAALAEAIAADRETRSAVVLAQRRARERLVET